MQSKYMHTQYLKMHNMSFLLPLWVVYHDSTIGYDAIPLISCQYGVIEGEGLTSLWLKEEYAKNIYIFLLLGSCLTH